MTSKLDRLRPGKTSSSPTETDTNTPPNRSGNDQSGTSTFGMETTIVVSNGMTGMTPDYLINPDALEMP